MDIRAQRDADALAVRQLITEAFADDGRVASVAAALRVRNDRQAAFVAVADDVIVGHVQLSVSWVDAPTRLVEVLVLSPLSVAPSHRSRGIGGRLQLTALAAARTLRAPLVFLEGDPAYYRRFGWRPAGELGFVPPSVRIPEAAFQVTLLPSYDPATMTGALVYNDTFWRYDAVGLRDGPTSS
jgi:putative acetyltransferase